jgi:hypothetical protein
MPINLPSPPPPQATTLLPSAPIRIFNKLKACGEGKKKKKTYLQQTELAKNTGNT